MLETREGGCHYGRVRFRATVDLDLLSQCSCTVCTKIGDPAPPDLSRRSVFWTRRRHRTGAVDCVSGDFTHSSGMLRNSIIYTTCFSMSRCWYDFYQGHGLMCGSDVMTKTFHAVAIALSLLAVTPASATIILFPS